jgi:hypothetical protein
MKKSKLMALLSGTLFLTILGIFTPSLAANSNEIILPLKFSSQGFPIVSIQVQGHDIPLIFDSGAHHNSIVLNNALVKKLNLKMTPTNKKACGHDDTGKETCLKTYVISEIKLGNMAMHNMPCQLMNKLWGGHYDEGFILFEASKNGVVGLDLLRQFNVLVDYKNSRAILTKLGEYPRQYKDIKNWSQIPFSDKYGITTSSKINNINTNLVWDTGANDSIIKSTSKVFLGKTSCESISNPSCFFETTTFTNGNKQLPKIKFFIQKDELPFDGLIGSSFFKEHIVFFDFKNKLVLVK